MTVHCGSHFLPGEQCHDFLLRGNKLSGLGFLQRLTYEMGKHFNFGTRKQLPDPEKECRNNKTVNQGASTCNNVWITL